MAEYDRSVFLLAFIPLSSVFIMLTFMSICVTFSLSPSLDWMITAGAVLLLTSDLLMFGMNQYHQKKNEYNHNIKAIGTVTSCSYPKSTCAIRPFPLQ